jgi:hypothetical protein
MTRKVWFWFLVGWLASMAFGPRQLLGMFGSKKSAA